MSTSAKRGLGKGLGALIPQNTPIPQTPMPFMTGRSVVQLDINKIVPNPRQPRKQFDDDKLLELSSSIKEQGVTSPLLVRKRGNAFELIAGERRLRASKKAGLATVPVIIKDYSDEQSLEIAMTPMIDVIFLLLIFFISTSSFQPPDEVLPTNMSLPGSSSETVAIDPLEEDLDEIVVKVLWRDGRPRWEVNQRRYEQLGQVGAVLSAVAGFQADLPVILDVEGVVPMENVIDVYDLCRRIGLQRIQFAAAAGS